MSLPPVDVDSLSHLLDRAAEAVPALDIVVDDFELRSKKLRESRLDEMPGLGPKRKAALLARFGSIQKLRQASVAELAEVAGVSDKLAAEIAKFLEGR